MLAYNNVHADIDNNKYNKCKGDSTSYGKTKTKFPFYFFFASPSRALQKFIQIFWKMQTNNFFFLS